MQGTASATAIVNPFDTIKVKMQVQDQPLFGPKGRIYFNTFHCAKMCIQQDGLIKGLWAPGLTVRGFSRGKYFIILTEQFFLGANVSFWSRIMEIDK